MKNNRILIVDDDKTILDAFRRILEAEVDSDGRDPFDPFVSFSAYNAVTNTATPSVPRDCFDVTTSTIGEEAVTLFEGSLAEGRPFAVAFVDMRIPPGIDGLETARRLRKLDDRIYIVIVTAYTDHSTDELQDALQHGILLVRKPFSEEEVFQLARNLCVSWDRDADLVRAKERAESASRAKGDFLDIMSHELRTPIHGMLGATQMLQEDAALLNQEQRDLVAIQLESGHRLLNLVTSILDFSQLDSDKIRLESTPFSMRDVLEQVTQSFRLKAEEKGLFLTFQTAQTDDSVENAACDPILGDPDRIHQIISKLLENAVRFTQQGGITVTLNQTAANPSDILISVQDTGIGIPADKLDLIFDIFTQADTSWTRSYDGVGMGLAIAKRLTNLMGGTLQVTSREGEGSTFQFAISSLPTYHCQQ